MGTLVIPLMYEWEYKYKCDDQSIKNLIQIRTIPSLLKGKNSKGKKWNCIKISSFFFLKLENILFIYLFVFFKLFFKKMCLCALGKSEPITCFCFPSLSFFLSKTINQSYQTTPLCFLNYHHLYMFYNSSLISSLSHQRAMIDSGLSLIINQCE